jgi:hypothetical protein
MPRDPAGILEQLSYRLTVRVETRQDYKLEVCLKSVATNERTRNRDADMVATQRGGGNRS